MVDVPGAFRQEEEYGRAALAGWIKNAAVPGVIAQFKERAEESVAPLSRILHDQESVYRL